MALGHLGLSTGVGRFGGLRIAKNWIVKPLPFGFISVVVQFGQIMRYEVLTMVFYSRINFQDSIRIPHIWNMWPLSARNPGYGEQKKLRIAKKTVGMSSLIYISVIICSCRLESVFFE